MSFPFSASSMERANHLSFVHCASARVSDHQRSERGQGVHFYLRQRGQGISAKTPSPSFRKSGKPRAKASIWSRSSRRSEFASLDSKWHLPSRPKRARCASSAKGSNEKYQLEPGEIPGTVDLLGEVFAGIRSLLTSKPVYEDVTDVEQNLQIQFYAYAAARSRNADRAEAYIGYVDAVGISPWYHHMFTTFDFDAFEEGLLYAYAQRSAPRPNTRRERCFRCARVPIASTAPRYRPARPMLGSRASCFRIWRTRTSACQHSRWRMLPWFGSSSLKFGRSGRWWTALCAISHGRPHCVGQRQGVERA